MKYGLEIHKAGGKSLEALDDNGSITILVDNGLEVASVTLDPANVVLLRDFLDEWLDQ